MKEILAQLNSEYPYCEFLGLEFREDSDGEIIGVMPFQEHLIGNPLLPALHGGAIAGFLEATALATLIINHTQENNTKNINILPKTINVTTEYLRPGRPVDSFAKASIHRVGRRYASLEVHAWQDEINSPIALCYGHFLVADWNK